MYALQQRLASTDQQTDQRLRCVRAISYFVSRLSVAVKMRIASYICAPTLLQCAPAGAREDYRAVSRAELTTFQCQHSQLCDAYTLGMSGRFAICSVKRASSTIEIIVINRVPTVGVHPMGLVAQAPRAKAHDRLSLVTKPGLQKRWCVDTSTICGMDGASHWPQHCLFLYKMF